ncbi:condensation domain-containing protein, partial [Streptomyces sp. TR06-5]|uniref:condensation domain-containing protein n=1 Tax=unclassified Streptomyces TaxID=2593676 RepID=UPI00399FF545
MDQDLDVDAFRDAWSQVMRRHPILRTSFWETESNDRYQLVWDDARVPLEVEDWRSRTPEAQQEQLQEYLQKDRTRGFTPQDMPQWRMLLVRTADATYQLVWSAHHAILDGWSISRVMSELV